MTGEPGGAEHLLVLAHNALHASCPLTPPAQAMSPEVARTFALGYLQLALLPIELWDGPVPEVEGSMPGVGEWTP